ncbi:MAG: hypothetical protein KBE25_10290, partial [Laribacter sp.]|nr:hypothetical protein [Laribacter sp.]
MFNTEILAMSYLRFQTIMSLAGKYGIEIDSKSLSGRGECYGTKAPFVASATRICITHRSRPCLT